MKLYSNEELIEIHPDEFMRGRVTPEDELEETELDHEELATDLEDISISIESALHEAELVVNVTKNISSYQKGSIEYLTAMENYRVVLDNISKKHGGKVVVPAMESFNNSYALNDSHNYAMEGIKETLAKIWTHIKDLFKRFFSKLGQFFRVLTKSNLKLEEYEVALSKMITRIRSKGLKYSGPELISTRLDEYFAPVGNYEMELSEFNNTHYEKYSNLTEELNASNNNIILLSISVEGLIEKMSSNINNPTELDNQISSVINDALARVFKYKATGNDIMSSDVIREFNNSMGDIGPTQTIHSLVVDNSDSRGLPKQFNIYYGRSDTGKVTVVINNMNEGSFRRTLSPIVDGEMLGGLYDRVRNDYKRVSVKSTSKAVSDFSKNSDKLFNYMSKEYSKVLDNLSDQLSNQQAVSNESIEAILSEANSSSDLDTLINIQDIVKGYTSSVRTVVNGLAHNLSDLEYKCRYELYRYIYECGRHYK